jgi:hypothetical protein
MQGRSFTGGVRTLRTHSVCCLCKRCIGNLTDEILGLKALEKRIIPGLIDWRIFKKEKKVQGK